MTVADLAYRLVAQSSPSGQEGAVAEIVREAMEDLGYAVEVDRLGNVVGTLDLGPGPCVLFDSHMDTVGVNDPGAWTRSPHGEVDAGRLYGRGSMDMKGPLAASILGAARLRGGNSTGRVVVAATVAEELVEGPALVEVAQRVHPDRVVICEATGLRLAVGQRGRAEVLVQVQGLATHSSRPELGINAADAMADVVRALRAIDIPHHHALGDGILVVTDVISTPYPGLSVVPDGCSATFDRRTLPGELADSVLAPIREAAEEAVSRTGASVQVSLAVDDFTTYSGAPISASNFAPAWYTDPATPWVVSAKDALQGAGIDRGLVTYAFCTNGSGTAALGIPTIGFGPGEEQLAHRPDEHILLSELDLAADGYAALAQALLAH